jgi:hypothetical protein
MWSALVAGAVLAGRPGSPSVAAGAAAGQAAESGRHEPQDSDWESLFPEAEGRDYVTALCQSCHSLKSTALARLDAGGWRRVVIDMNAKGADLFTEDMGFIVKYLAEHFNTKRPPLELPVNLNTAGTEQLAQLAVLTGAEVMKIDEARKRKPFAAIADLRKVIADDKVAKIRPFVVVR